jgi:hypothetical protein
MLGWRAMPSVLTMAHLVRLVLVSVCVNLQVEATVVVVGAYVDKKYTASRPPVKTVVVMGKCTVAG